ncbi:LUD domain-containing protein [Candidatus Woesearchaeota archaeon]|nr:LUD domain-containing protein [Candidatus Woesearchaeota archaeon]
MASKWEKLADEKSIKTAIAALKENGIEALFAETSDDAKKKVIGILPKGADVMDMTSMTLEAASITKEIKDSGKYNSIKAKLMSMDRKTQGSEMQKLGAAPDWVVGSVHAVTEDGHVLIASASGSQLPAYAYGASHVIWVAGTHKIVKNVDEGIKRIYEHSLPMESERAKLAYGVPGSAVNKLLIFNKEFQPGRVTLILVNEVLGF